MMYQITEQANGKFSIYTDSGQASMADEDLIAFDLTNEEVTEKMCDIGGGE
jgi:hypothetical protein